MTFTDWQSLPPDEAARRILQGAKALPPGQRRAAIASLPSASDLMARFLTAPPGRPLSGVPFFVKDLFDVAGEPTRAGSAFLSEVRPAPAGDGAMVRALREAGAVVVGKTHLHEFAYGLTGDNPHYGNCEHPRFPGRTTGGSSSGSAAVVGSGIVPLALATDTGGSVRVPAAYCGLYGFRSSPGNAWIADAFPLAPSFDTAGWFTAEASDLLMAIEALIPGRGSEANGDYSTPRGCYLEMPGLDGETGPALRTAAAMFAPPADHATADALNAAFAGSAEAYSVLTSCEAAEAHKDWLDPHRSRYSPDVWARIDRGRAWTPEQVAAARGRRAEVRRAWDAYFLERDFLALAATPFPAPMRDAIAPDSRARILALTAPASLGGRPAVTIPVALPSGLTSGLQFVFRDTQSPAIAWVLKARY